MKRGVLRTDSVRSLNPRSYPPPLKGGSRERRPPRKGRPYPNRSMEKDYLPIGRVVKPHGVAGKMKVKYFGQDLGQFSSYREVQIEDLNGRVRTYEVMEAAPHPPRIILRLRGIERIEDVLPLLGKDIAVRRDALPELEEGEYFWFEILGMVVKTDAGREIGTVKEILPTAAHDVYVVEGRKREIYLPATEEVIGSIDRGKGVMKVIWMEGLWEKEDEI
jgi:16S rRNA processing protein RimM